MNHHSRVGLLIGSLALTTIGFGAMGGLTTPAQAAAGTLGTVTGFSADGDTYVVSAGEAKVRLTLADDDLVHVEMAPDGNFTDPANEDPQDPNAPDADIIVKGDYSGAGSTYTETGDAYVISTDDATLTVAKDPLTLSLADASGKVLFSETSPLAWTDAGTTQSLSRGPDEQFFGGGMQNGRFSHRGKTIEIDADYNWNDGGNPNPVPFYVSSNGYGVLRNTFAAGAYAFNEPVATTHKEQRFDAYYFVGDAAEAIDGYTELTGRPIAVPMYALEIGDADCYLHNANRGERETLRDSTAIAEGYQEHQLPLGWMLVNDGYGCEYEDLPETGQMLNDHQAELGLWTQRDLTDQESEVAAGVRVRKTDVAWVGPGYRFALDACEKSRDGIEDNSTDRATVVTIEGWAGTQRCGIPWSGDQSGDWEYIRWQIPTYAGSTMSGLHLTTGDVDGIFGGSAKTYVRDMQWKMMLPVTYLMSGWASSDKQPWRYGEPYTAINRKYMMLHEQLLPYFYTHTMRATQNGVGATKPLYLNYPDDPKTWGDDVKYEFLAGDDFLVAPVYQDTSTRDGIYLPEGTWIDYWTGRLHQGPKTIDAYHAPLDTLPLFVRAGAVIPQFEEGTMDWAEGKASGRLALDIYPQGESSFVNYEDDGRSQQHESGASATQQFDVTAPQSGAGDVTVTIGSVDGEYEGKPAQRGYTLTVHTDTAPKSVTIGGNGLRKPVKLRKARSLQAFQTATESWFHDEATGITHVRTDAVSTGGASTVTLTKSSAVGGANPTARDVSLSAAVPAISTPGEAQSTKATFTNNTGAAVQLTDAALSVPQGWSATATSPTRATVESDASFEVSFEVTPPADTAPGSYPISATFGYEVARAGYTVKADATTTLAHANLASAFNNVGVTATADPAPGNIDGGGNSFLAESLAELGVTPGASVSANGFDFTWPDVAPGNNDNAAGASATVRVDGVGQGNALAFLGTGTSGTAAGSVTVHYADGSSSNAAMGFPNWCCLDPSSYGAKIAIATKGRNTPTGPGNETVDYRLYTKTVPIDATKQVVALTLPDNSSVHIFAVAVGNEEFVPPPIEDGQYSLGNVGSELALQAPGSAATQVTTAAPSSDPSQKWNVVANADGTYLVKNAGSGLCLDVFSSSTTPGSIVGQYTCTGGANQQWNVAQTDAGLKITSDHSGLSLAVDDAGLAVQQTDSGAATQRWKATAN